jgi:hypothetical protein
MRARLILLVKAKSNLGVKQAATRFLNGKIQSGSNLTEFIIGGDMACGSLSGYDYQKDPKQADKWWTDIKHPEDILPFTDPRVKPALARIPNPDPDPCDAYVSIFMDQQIVNVTEYSNFLPKDETNFWAVCCTIRG